MKNVLKLSMLVIFITTGLRSHAVENLEVKVSGNQLLLVEFQDVKQGSLLSFQDIRGEILFKDSLFPYKSYRKTLNLELVPEGVYYLNLNLPNHIITTVITKGISGLEITGKTTKPLFRPLYRVEGKTVKIFYTNIEKRKGQLRIYDSRNVLVETISFSDQTIRKTLDFSQIPSGEYTIQAQLGDQFFDRKLLIK